MIVFLLGLASFFAPHLFSALGHGKRNAIVEKIGLQPFKGLYVIVSLAGFALFVWAWPRADMSVIYTTPYWLRNVTYLLTLMALIILMSGYLPQGKIAAAVKHPMLAAVKLWAVAHLLVNGDVRSILLFGSFLAFAVIDRIAVKRRGAPVPSSGPVINDLYPVAIGLAAWVAIYLYLHPYIAGVAIAH